MYSIAHKVAFLSRPSAYPTQPQQVEVIETHISWVFLTDRHAYKLKKPVRYDYLDFSSLAARCRDCAEEVRLNRRLAARVYHGVVPLTVDERGNMRLGGKGQTVECLVKMRRLAPEQMLDTAIAQGTVREADVRKVGALLARFYTQAPPVAITPAAYRQRLAQSVRDNHHALARPVYELPADVVETVAAVQLACLDRHPDLFEARVRAGRVIEAHGDLRPEHVCLEDEPVIIDCLEFNLDFRILDTVSELAFLALECERLGAARLGEVILETYASATGEEPPELLLAFYKSYHAFTRTKIAAWHLRDAEVSDPATWTRKANHYLQLAARLTPSMGGR